MTSELSSASLTRSAMRMLVFARISGETTPLGRWVASIRWMPRLRPSWAMLTSPVTNSGRSFVSWANSSMTSSSRGSGGRPGSRRCSRW
jgi:hypothetical protein